MIPVKYGVDIYNELPGLIDDSFEYLTFSSVIDELEGISSTNRRDAVAAKTALMLVKSNNIKIIKNNGYVDELIRDYATGNNDVIVCTNDVKLRSYLTSKGVKVVCLRDKSRLMLL